MDRQVLISVALGVGAICATIVGSTCATNGRFNDLHADIIDLRQEIRSVRDEVQNVRDEVQSVRGLLIDHIDGHDRAEPGG